jgi:hypothetical protein
MVADSILLSKHALELGVEIDGDDLSASVLPVLPERFLPSLNSVDKDAGKHDPLEAVIPDVVRDVKKPIAELNVGSLLNEETSFKTAERHLNAPPPTREYPEQVKVPTLNIAESLTACNGTVFPTTFVGFRTFGHRLLPLFRVTPCTVGSARLGPATSVAPISSPARTSSPGS